MKETTESAQVMTLAELEAQPEVQPYAYGMWYVGGLPAGNLAQDARTITANAYYTASSREKPTRILLYLAETAERAIVLVEQHNAPIINRRHREALRSAAQARSTANDPSPFYMAEEIIAAAKKMKEADEADDPEMEEKYKVPLEAYRIALWHLCYSHLEDVLKDIVDHTEQAYDWESKRDMAVSTWRSALMHPAVLCANQKCSGEVTPDYGDTDYRCNKCLTRYPNYPDFGAEAKGKR